MGFQTLEDPPLTKRHKSRKENLTKGFAKRSPGFTSAKKGKRKNGAPPGRHWSKIGKRQSESPDLRDRETGKKAQKRNVKRPLKSSTPRKREPPTTKKEKGQREATPGWQAG